jgi:predicted ATP-dependent serine protease
MANEFKKECGVGMYWCNTDQKCKPMQEDARIPKKSGQPDNSDKHSDLYTDEDPKGTIQGLKFATTQDAKESISKIKNSGRSHAHKIQAAIAMEQRARVMGKTEAAGVYRGFINSMKKKTKDMREDWSQKYKKSIDCNNPKGFSQKAHCQGRKKRMSEDAPANAVGTGSVAGLGVGAQGEPGVNKKKGLTPFIAFIRRKKPQ